MFKPQNASQLTFSKCFDAAHERAKSVWRAEDVNIHKMDPHTEKHYEDIGDSHIK